MEKMDTLKLIEGGIAVDDRGQLTFFNNFNYSSIKRFYIVENHRENFVRAWHGHKNESKFVLCINGAALLSAIKIDNRDKPSKDLEPTKFVLSSTKPSILYIPQGYANGFMTLRKDTKLIFYSTSTLEESMNDDYRFDSYYWNSWGITER